MGSKIMEIYGVESLSTKPQPEKFVTGWNFNAETDKCSTSDKDIGLGKAMNRRGGDCYKVRLRHKFEQFQQVSRSFQFFNAKLKKAA